MQPAYPLLYSLPGYRYCDLLLSKGEHAAASKRAHQTLEWVRATELAARNRARHTHPCPRTPRVGFVDHRRPAAGRLCACRCPRPRAAFDQAIERLRASALTEFLSRGLLARAAFRRSVGDWDGAARDLDEVEEIAEPGPMRLYLCDMALERARLAFARLEAFAPLNGLVDNSPAKPALPDAAEAARLREQATENLAAARKLIADCGYHRRDEELAELDDVAAGRRRFADLPPRV